MTIKRARFCLYCQRAGITETFDTGKALRKHVASKHPRTSAQRSEDKNRLRIFRRDVLLVHVRLKARPK